jgi:hypothetical protein
VAGVCCSLGGCAVGAKRNARRRRWPTEIALPLVVILLISALLQSRSLRQLLAEARGSVGHSVIPSWTGVMLCLLGVGLAIHARWHLGRNQGMPMSRKEQPELVTRALRTHPSPDRHGTDSGEVRFRDGRNRFLGAAWSPGRRILHLQCPAQGNRAALGFEPGVVSRPSTWSGSDDREIEMHS